MRQLPFEGMQFGHRNATVLLASVDRGSTYSIGIRRLETVSARKRIRSAHWDREPEQVEAMIARHDGKLVTAAWFEDRERHPHEGILEIQLDDGTLLRALPDPHYEGWIVRRNGEIWLVSMPGGESAEFER